MAETTPITSSPGQSLSTTPFATSMPLWLEPATKPWVAELEAVAVGDDALVAQAAADWAQLAPDDVSAGDRRQLRVTTAADVAALPDVLRGPVERALMEQAPGAEGYVVVRTADGELVVAGADGAGALYGTLRLLVVGPEVLLGSASGAASVGSTPWLPLRMLNHWDNLVPHPVMGTVERGYAGDSIFWEGGELTQDLGRLEDYALLLASLGINAISVNNVNVHAVETTLLTERLDYVRRIAEIMRRHHVSTYMSVNFASPIVLGGLDTCDPLDDDVKAWWKRAVDHVYDVVPDLGGFVVKADSEGQPGPFAYGRDHADGANLLAEALAPHNGTVMWRCFVYNHRQDWRDRTLDRARAAYDHFMPLDGRFADNVILQVKNGPIDFQVREPVSPLLLGLEATRTALELQVTQEYTGHEIDTYFLPTSWKEVLGLDVAGDGGMSLAEHLGERRGAAIVAVANVGRDDNWTGNTFSQANLYGYGRLAWDPTESEEAIASEWAAATFSGDERLHEALTDILLMSRRAYENYTSPLGVGFMVTPGGHYGPNIDGYEYSPWGTYHFADRDGVGVDRTPSGSGYTEQYPAALATRYRDLSTCPERMLLFFHHVSYNQTLPESGVSLIQRIYDTHYEGVEEVRRMRELWDAVKWQVAEGMREDIDRRWVAQEHNATEWRDQVCTYFLRHSGVPDEKGRTIYA